MKHPFAIVALLALAGLAAVSQLYLPLPLLPLIGRQFGLEPAAASAALGAFSLAYAAGFLLFGPLSDRLGRKPVMVGGLLALGIVTLLLSQAATPSQLIAGRALQGLATAAFPPAALAYLAESMPARLRLWALAWLSTAFLLAGLVGQIYGGMAGQALGLAWAIALPCPIYLGAAWLLARLPREQRAASASLGAHYAGLFSVLRKPELRGVYAPALLLVLCFMAFYLGLDRYQGSALRAAGLSPLATRAVAVPGFLMPLAVAVLLPRFGAQRMVSAGLATAAAGLLLASCADGLGLLLLSSVLFVAGVGIGVPSLIARTSALADASWRGQAVSLYTFLMFSGASLGPVLAQAMNGLRASTYFAALAMLMGGALLFSLPRSQSQAAAVKTH
ncbi:MFS transporter [Massilia sp. BJB1822]|uniref:MFS transporter n=1 Tax=Massilia sp. BJB1822 TaxID=2744470 RepID=UPI00159333FB|nr:MFS transporter [Massilia sp. BJB1822]NVD99200.1 MFS transporter [Massilia sp. BJB1822]